MEEKHKALSDLASKYSTKIHYVALVKSDEEILGWARRCLGSEIYVIQINTQKTKCTKQIMFVLYHEIAHVVLNHVFFHWRTQTSWTDTEREADDWAFKKMIENGFLTKDDKRCRECVSGASVACLEKTNKS
jgi:Zn-dependent peptidase ImmA (M78 family)